MSYQVLTMKSYIFASLQAWVPSSRSTFSNPATILSQMLPERGHCPGSQVQPGGDDAGDCIARLVGRRQTQIQSLGCKIVQGEQTLSSSHSCWHPLWPRNRRTLPSRTQHARGAAQGDLDTGSEYRAAQCVPGCHLAAQPAM